MRSSCIVLAIASIANASVFPRGAGLEAVPAPQGCRRIKIDADFPAAANWKSALPGVIVEKRKAGKTSPDYRFVPKTVEEVQNAVKFANKNNIRLAIISTGHDFQTRSDAASGLLLDMSNFKSVKALESFEPTVKGAESPSKKTNVITPIPGKQAAVTFGGAISTQALNNALAPSKLFTMGAAWGEVAPAGGWGQQGGHGPLTSQYGLGVDQWLEAKIVTADGQLKIANKVSNPDLFWAIRGGGGGVFGAIVEATWKAYPDIPITGLQWWINSTKDFDFKMDPNAGMNQAMAHLTASLPDVSQKGVSAYIYMAPNNIRLWAVHPDRQSGTAQANAVWKPILDKMQSFPDMTKYQTKVYNFKNFKEFYDTTYGPIHGGEMGTMSKHMRAMYRRHDPGEMEGSPTPVGKMPADSRVLNATHLRSPGMLGAIAQAGTRTSLMLLAGKGDGSGKPDEETSTTPAWRTHIVHAFAMNIPGMMSAKGFQDLAPDSGAYLNEAYYQQTSWKTTFWGENYPKLSAIKTKYDPKIVFWASPGINADHMEMVDGRLCSVSEAKQRVIGASSTPPLMDSNWVANLQSKMFEASEIIKDFPAPGTQLGLQAA